MKCLVIRAEVGSSSRLRKRRCAAGADTSSPITAGVTGAGHGSEMNYIFNNLYGTDRPWTAQD